MEIFLQSFQYIPFLNKFYLIYFSSTICVTFFADNCLKMKLLMKYALYYAEFKKMHRFAYTL